MKQLWHRPDFLKLWGGETLSLFGSQVTVLALPLTAILTLHATPAQLGLLGAARYAPFLLVTIFVGVWVDHHRRRPILMGANLGRAILLGLIPLTVALGVLRIEYLYVIAFLVGVLQVFFDLAYRAFLPSLVPRDQLIQANSRLEASSSSAEIGGPALGGFLVQLLTAPFAILVDAASFLISLGSLLLIRAKEPGLVSAPNGGRRKLWDEIRSGLRYTFGNPSLRAIGLEAATYNLFETLILTLFMVYAVRQLGVSSSTLGLMLAAGSVGALLGSLVAQVIERRWGFGPTLIASMVLACTAFLLIPLVHGAIIPVVSILIVAFFLNGIGLSISSIQAVSLRQLITPDQLLGRVNASYLLVVYGAMPLGALLGGTLGSWLGLRTALLIGACCLPLALVWVVFSPLRRLRTLDHLIVSQEAAPSSETLAPSLEGAYSHAHHNKERARSVSNES